MIYGYARVSTKEQNESRQIELLNASGVDCIRTDKASGKNFDREEYTKLAKLPLGDRDLREGDTLVICSIDRLGRDYTEIQSEWKYLTQELKVNIKVLDMDLLDTTRTENLDGKFIADLTLQILSYVAQKERESIKKRQRQGIDSCPTIDGKKVSSKTGVKFGRPSAEFPEDFENAYNEWKQGNINATECMKRLNLKRTTFYKLVKEYENRWFYL